MAGGIPGHQKEGLITSCPGTDPGPADHLAEFKSSVRWAVGNLEWDPKSEKWKKSPRCPRTGKRLSVNRPEEWICSYEEAVRAREEKGYDFIGPLLTRKNPYHLTDQDGVIDGEEIDPRSKKIIAEQDTYTERSISGTGFHSIGIAKKSENQRKKFELDGQEVESYDDVRFMVFTGDVIHDRPIRDVQGWVDGVVPMRTASTGSVEVKPVDAEDEEIVRRALDSKNGGRFRKLFVEGDVSEYLHPDGREDRSAADIALCGVLAFWTGRDPERIDRLFRSSALMREKWDREDYRDSTIGEAVKNCVVVYEEVPEEVLNALRALRMNARWKNFNACHVYRAHVEMAAKKGRPVAKGQKTTVNRVGFEAPEDGIAYYAAVRDLSVEAGIDKNTTVSDANKVLREMGLLRLISQGTMKRASVFLLPASPPFSDLVQTEHGGGGQPIL